MVLEGGSIAVDGDGTLVTTDPVPDAPEPQPAPHPDPRSRTALRAELGVDVILWLPHGLALDDDTDGHVDNVAAFARPGVLVLQGCDDPVEADRLRADVEPAQRHRRQRRRTAGRSRWSRCRCSRSSRSPGERVGVPYLNYYVGNGFVVVPVCGHDADDDMVAMIAEQYPGRDAIAARRRRHARLRRRRHPLHHPAGPRPRRRLTP